jgi:alpha 1,2-mannosyltransferase
MRYKPRITRTIALTLFLVVLIYLYTSDRVHTSLTEQIHSFKASGNLHHDDPTSKTENPAFTDIHSLWAYWNKIFHDARPGAEPIRLSSNANTISISSDDHSARQASQNHVLNSEADIESLRASHATLLSTLQSEDVVGDIFNGTGIVIVGGGEYFGPAIIGLHMLRKAGCTLPVEIFVADASEYEASLCEEYLPRYGARCLVLTDFLRGPNSTAQSFEVTHYQLKSLAMLFSSFTEILYLDSDSIPLIDPSELFSAEPYVRRGLVIWPDFWVSTESPLFYTIAGLRFPPNLPKTSSEAGQVLINKRTHLKTLLLAIYYNIYGPDYYYPLLSQGVLGQGDKETFMAAALVSGQSFYRVKTGVASVGRHNGEEFKGSGMVQYHPFDDLMQNKGNDTVVRPAFVHANTPKMNAGHLVDEGDLFAIDQKRLRLWGPKEDQEKRFGRDLEKRVWELLVQTGCELEQVVGEWKGRERMCHRLEEHWKEVF